MAEHVLQKGNPSLKSAAFVWHYKLPEEAVGAPRCRCQGQPELWHCTALGLEMGGL